jgi:hypothetical protein
MRTGLAGRFVRRLGEGKRIASDKPANRRLIALPDVVAWLEGQRDEPPDLNVIRAGYQRGCPRP